MSWVVRKDNNIIVRSILSFSHDCQGEEIILRLISENRAVVMYSDRCTLDPSTQCDGIPSMRAGDCVFLPEDWLFLETFELPLLNAEKIFT